MQFMSSQQRYTMALQGVEQMKCTYMINIKNYVSGFEMDNFVLHVSVNESFTLQLLTAL